MSKRFLPLALLIALLAACQPSGDQIEARLVAEVQEAAGYARAGAPQPMEFPADHGPHPDFQTEWWYFTGNLDSSDGRRFGYQLTFFRRALTPPHLRAADRTSEWAADQVYMAHFALTDAEGGEFIAFERFSRGAAGLAGAQAAPFSVWLEDWRVTETDNGSWQLAAAQDGVSLTLELADMKGPILQGNEGYSQKGPEAGNASMYYSLTRLASEGSVTVDGKVAQVQGYSWMDHEYSTSALSDGQVGWDWFSIQLDDNSELMMFQIRREDGTVDPFSSGTMILGDGRTVHLPREAFTIDVEGTWTSPRSGARYPAGWIITVPEAQLRLELEPLVSDQELDVSYAYWEGAVTITGKKDGRTVEGRGYVEMTGYAASMQGEF